MYANTSIFAQYVLLPFMVPWQFEIKWLENIKTNSDRLRFFVELRRRGTISEPVTPWHIRKVGQHMRVRPTDIPGVFRLALATLRRALAIALVFDDNNDAHVNPDRPSSLFAGTKHEGKNFAHGADIGAQAFMAQMALLKMSGCAPSGILFTFADPVFFNKTRCQTKVIPVHDPMKRTIQVVNASDVNGKPIQIINFELHEGTMSDDELRYLMLAFGYVSGLLARIWRNCVYCKQWFVVHAIRVTSELHVSVKGMRFDDKNRLHVETIVTNADGELVLEGYALIYPNGIKPPPKAN